jgi:ABC-type sugar transport system substrate-binding protein
MTVTQDPAASPDKSKAPRRIKMRVITKYGSLAALLLIASANAAVAQTASQVPMSGPKPDGSPSSVTMPWGTFKLSDKIAEKVAKHEPLNVVYSYMASGLPLFSQQQLSGFQSGCASAESIYPITCSSIAPVQPDANQQVSQIQAKLAVNQVDCMSILPVTSDSAERVVNDMMDKGIPVFTVGLPTHGHEFTNFTQIPLKEGATAAKVVLDWMKANGKDLKVFAVSGGDPSQTWAQGRMKGFHDAIMAAIPGAKFLATETNPINTSYNPGKVYDTYRTFLVAHPEVQFIENVDFGAEHADRAIAELNRTGQVFTIGWNVSKGQLDGIEKDIQVALLDQRWPDQGAFGAAACARFVADGEVLPNTQTLQPVLKANVPAARAELAKTL